MGDVSVSDVFVGGVVAVAAKTNIDGGRPTENIYKRSPVGAIVANGEAVTEGNGCRVVSVQYSARYER